jgi:hypothetical protein
MPSIAYPKYFSLVHSPSNTLLLCFGKIGRRQKAEMINGGGKLGVALV